MQDLFVVSILTILRIGVPVVLTLGIGYLLLRYSKAQFSADIQAPPEAAALGPGEWARAVTIPPRVPCWEQMACAETARANCPAYNRSHVPCWLAVQVAEGQLRAECVSCDMYRLEKRQPPYFRVIKGGKPDKEAAGGEAVAMQGKT